MLSYWLVFILFAWMALTRLSPQIARGGVLYPGKWGTAWIGIFLLLVLFIGLRHEVGGDWFNYLGHVEGTDYDGILEAISHGDPAYTLLNWLANYVGGGIYLVNTICAALFTWGLLAFCRIQSRPWLALLVAAPYLVTVVAMGYTRQGVAIGLAMLGLAALLEGRITRFVFWIAFAGLFHKSAVILLPLAIFARAKNRGLGMLGVSLSAVLLYVLLLQEAVEGFLVNYIEAEYQSSGAAIRVAMNALPALVFLLWRKRFVMGPEQLSFWTWMSVAALAFVALLVVSPSSTAVDRVALYWIPLQLVVWSQLPDVFGQPGQRNPLWVCGVVGYCAAVLFVWLFYADHSFAWLPYQFYPWVWLWS